MRTEVDVILEECDKIFPSPYPNQTMDKLLILATEVRRLREERTQLLDEAAKRATAWWYSGDESAKRGVDPELDRLADELRAAVLGEVK